MADRRPLTASLLMIGSTVSWRSGIYYSGGADPVVVLKGVLSVAALVIAYGAAQTASPKRELGTRSFWLLGIYLVSSLFGASATGNFVASGVLALRLAILAATVFFLLRACDRLEVVSCLVKAMAVFAVVGSVTWLFENVAAFGPAGWLPGTASLLAHSRLHGSIPALTSNELAFLCATTFLALVWRSLHDQQHRFDIGAMVVFAGMVWLTGSRTGLLALVVALVVMLVQVRRWPVPGFLAGVALVPVLVYAIVGAGLLSSYFNRGGSASVGTLSNRTVAWSAATHLYDTFWGQAFGSGLSVKQIPVAGQWWNVQILDSSWVSALVQAGLVGLILLGIWTVWNVAGATLIPRPDRLILLSLLVFIVSRSALESGLLDATPAFCLFFAISLSGESRTRGAASRRPAHSITGAEVDRRLPARV